MPDVPISVRWTLHALDKAKQLDCARHDVEVALVDHHAERRRNVGQGAWQLAVGRLVIVYEYPDGGDSRSARIVTLWRRR